MSKTCGAPRMHVRHKFDTFPDHSLRNSHGNDQRRLESLILQEMFEAGWDSDANIREQSLEYRQLLREKVDSLLELVILVDQFVHSRLGVDVAQLGLVSTLAYGDVVALASLSILVAIFLELAFLRRPLSWHREP